jgi:hydrogenase/urease accessory protein HupE
MGHLFELLAVAVLSGLAGYFVGYAHGYEAAGLAIRLERLRREGGHEERP